MFLFVFKFVIFFVVDNFFVFDYKLLIGTVENLKNKLNYIYKNFFIVVRIFWIIINFNFDYM